MSCVLGQTSGEASAAAVSMITRPATRHSRLTRGAASGALGSRLEGVDNQGDSETYHLDGAVESDPSAGRISVDSPVGRDLVGHKKGDRVTLSVPPGTLPLTTKAVK